MLSGITDNDIEERDSSPAINRLSKSNSSLGQHLCKKFLEESKILPKGPPPNFNNNVRKIDSINLWKPINEQYAQKHCQLTDNTASNVYGLPAAKENQDIMRNKGKL